MCLKLSMATVHASNRVHCGAVSQVDNQMHSVLVFDTTLCTYTLTNSKRWLPPGLSPRAASITATRADRVTTNWRPPTTCRTVGTCGAVHWPCSLKVRKPMTVLTMATNCRWLEISAVERINARYTRVCTHAHKVISISIQW